MGADRIDYSNTEPVPLFEEEYDPQVSSRTSITTFVEDLKRKKYEFDRMSLLEGRKPLKPTSDVEVALGRECRANKYQRNAEDMVVVMDKVLQVSGLWSQHLVSSALSAAAACTHATKEEHLKTQLFEKGMDLFQRYLKKCKRNEVLPYAFSAAISLCAKAQKPDEAVKIYNLRKNYPLMKPDPYIYSSLIQALARGGKMKEAKEMFDRANSIFHHLDQRLVSQSLSLFSKKGNYKYCLEIFTKMLSKGLIPSTFDFNVLVDSCCQYKVPKKIFDLIFETKGQLAELGCFPNDYTYEALLRACYNNKNLKKAVELIEELNRNATSSHYYWLFKTVEKTMNNPEYSYDSDTKLSAEDRCTLCLDALSRLRGFGIDPSMAVLNKVFSIMLKAEKQVNALLFLKDLKDGWGRLPDHSTWFHFLEYAKLHYSDPI
jgi:pentatricopeptide repeat protein